MINEILNYIATYTYHVLDEYGRPAKIPISLIKKVFEEKFPTWLLILEILKKKKWITSFNWGEIKQDNQTIRITTKGHLSSKLDIMYERRDIKRVLMWVNDDPYLEDFSDWSTRKFHYNNEGLIIYD